MSVSFHILSCSLSAARAIFWPTATATECQFPSTSFPVHCPLLVPSIYYTDSRRVCGSSSHCLLQFEQTAVWYSLIQSDTASALQNYATADRSNWGHPWFQQAVFRPTQGSAIQSKAFRRFGTLCFRTTVGCPPLPCSHSPLHLAVRLCSPRHRHYWCHRRQLQDDIGAVAVVAQCG